MTKTLHVLSTAPWRAALPATAFAKDHVDFMTMLLGALEWRKKGRVELWTDAVGKAWAQDTGLAELYHGIVGLPTLVGINHQMFWDACKVVALEMAGANALIADTDVVCFRRPVRWELLFDRMLSQARQRFFVGHYEPADWLCYRDNLDRFEDYGFRYGWNWASRPMNTCLLRIDDLALRKWYFHTAMSFMLNYSARPLPVEKFPEWRLQGVLFASQQILGMVADQFKVEPQTFFKMRFQHHEPTPNGFHLWGRKDVYRTCLEPRLSMMQWLRDRIEDHGEAGISILRANNLWQSYSERGELSAIARNGRAAMDHNDSDTPLTRTVVTNRGRFTAIDPCSGLKRTLRADGPDKIYRGDVLLADEDTSGSVQFNNKMYACIPQTIPGSGEKATIYEPGIWQTV